MDEKIEEMAKLIKPIVVSSYLVDRENDEVKQKAIEEVKKQQTRNATAIYNAGYRKESDTAREILTGIDDLTLFIIGRSNEFEKGYFQAIADMKTAIKDLIKEKYGVDLGAE
jgi:hypothetical protein